MLEKKMHYFWGVLFANAIVTACQAQIAFAPAVNYPSGASSYSVVLGDLHNDGNLDLKVTEATPQNTEIK
jgi:hypothetical protein